VPITEDALRHLEEHIPEMAAAAVQQAYWQALSTGDSVLEVREGVLVEVFPDGTTVAVKRMAEPLSVAKGQRVELP